MRRTNLLKKVACCAMILVMTGSTVLAGTVSRSQKVRNVTTYTNSYSGTAGNYCAASDGKKARTSIQSKLNGKAWFQGSVFRENHSTKTNDLRQNATKVLANGQTITVEIVRDKTSWVCDYHHTAKGCTTSSYSAATLIDNYKFIGIQDY